VGERSIINSKERGKKKKRKRQREGEQKLGQERKQIKALDFDYTSGTPGLYPSMICSLPKQQHENDFFFACFSLLSVLDLCLAIFRLYNFCGFLRFVKTLNPC
jgi:hypothetical protein